MATASTPREILEDRWEGVEFECEAGNDWTELMERLDKTLIELYERVARREHSGEVYATAKRPGFDGSGDVTGEMHAAVHRILIDGILKAEEARLAFPKPLAAAS